MINVLVVCGVVLFSWPIAVIIWRFIHREKPQATRDAYRAPPPPASPEPPWFVRWWDWANDTTWPRDFVVRHNKKILLAVGVLMGGAMACVLLVKVSVQPPTEVAVKVHAVPEAKAEGKYPGWTCEGSGFWVPEDRTTSDTKITVSCSADSYGGQKCVACDTGRLSHISCWRLERCP